MKRKKQFVINFLVTAFLLSPLSASAATIQTVLTAVRSIIEALIPLIFGIAFVVFLWGMYKYISAASEGAKEEGRNLIIYSIIGLFVMVSVWGLVDILKDTFLGTGALPGAPAHPKFPGETTP